MFGILIPQHFPSGIELTTMDSTVRSLPTEPPWKPCDEVSDHNAERYIAVAEAGAGGDGGCVDGGDGGGGGGGGGCGSSDDDGDGG